MMSALTSLCLFTVASPVASNVFMTYARYACLETLNHEPWVIAALLS
jgi:uncharacterized protein (DUF486 family)